jgi:hypothetical protein
MTLKCPPVHRTYRMNVALRSVSAAVFAHKSAAFGVGERGDGFEQQGVEAGLLVGGAASWRTWAATARHRLLAAAQRLHLGQRARRHGRSRDVSLEAGDALLIHCGRDNWEAACGRPYGSPPAVTRAGG